MRAVVDADVGSGVTRLVLTGHLDLAGAAAVRRVLKCLAQAPAEIVVDLARMTATFPPPARRRLPSRPHAAARSRTAPGRGLLHPLGHQSRPARQDRLGPPDSPTATPVTSARRPPMSRARCSPA